MQKHVLQQVFNVPGVTTLGNCHKGKIKNKEGVRGYNYILQRFLFVAKVHKYPHNKESFNNSKEYEKVLFVYFSHGFADESANQKLNNGNNKHYPENHPKFFS